MPDHNSSYRSINSTFLRGTRPESGRLKKSTTYRWLFNQMHAKVLIFNAQVLLIFLAVFGFFQTSQIDSATFQPSSIPGFDGLHWLSIEKRNTEYSYYPFSKTSKNLLNSVSYLYFTSAISALFGIQLSETSPSKRKLPESFNPAFLLLPSLFSVLSFTLPMTLWTLRSILEAMNQISNNFSIFMFFDVIRFIIIPLFIVWFVFVYVLLGFFDGFLYYYRRSNSLVRSNMRTPARRRSPSLKVSPKMAPLRFSNKACANLFPDTTSPPDSSFCSPSKLNSSFSPRSFIRQLETVDEETQSKSSGE